MDAVAGSGGQSRGILEAFREDGVARVTIFDPGMWYSEPGWWTWSNDDRWISYSGYEWDESVSPPEPVAAALYVVLIEFDAVRPLPLSPPVPVAEGGVWFSSPRFFTTIGNHDWSPEADRIVFSEYDRDTGPHLFTFDLAVGDVFPLALLGRWPSWSPDGQLRLGERFTIETIEAYDMDESSRKILFDVNWSKGSTNTDVDRPHWSPTGSHLAFLFQQNGSLF